MKLTVTLPTAVAGNLKVLERSPNQNIALHIGTLGEHAHLCIEYSVTVPTRSEEVPVILNYRLGKSDVSRTQMYLIEEPTKLMSGFESAGFGPDDEVWMDYSKDAGGLVVGRDGGEEGESSPSFVLKASRITGYKIPSDLPKRDKVSENSVVMFDGVQYAGVPSSQVDNSMLLVDLEGKPNDRALFAAALKQAVGLDIGPGDAFEEMIQEPQKEAENTPEVEPPAQTEAAEAAEAPKGPLVDIPEVGGLELPSIEGIQVGGPFVDVGGVGVVDEDEPAAPAAPPEVSIVPPEDAAESAEAKPSAAPAAEAAKVEAPVVPDPTPTAGTDATPPSEEEEEEEVDEEEEDSGEETSNDESGAEESKPRTRVRRKSADIDKDAEKRLVSRSYAVMPPAEAVFSGMTPKQAAERYREINVALSGYEAELLDRFLEAVVVDDGESREQLKLKIAELAAML